MARSVSAVLVGAMLLSLPLAASTAAAPLTFDKPVIVVPYPGTATATGPLQALPMGEPQMLITHTGRIVVAAQFEMWDCRTRQPLATTGIENQATGTSGQRLCVWASDDGGRSFHIIGGDCCQNGDDVSLAETPESGTLLESFMSNVGVGPGVPGMSLSRSTDNGATWADSLDIDKQVAQDRPFMFAESERNVLISFTAPPGNIFVMRSADQGRTWELPRPVMAVPPEAVLSLNGVPTVDRARHELVLSYASSSSHFASVANASGSLNVIGIARSRDHGATWTTETAATLPPGQGVASIPALSADDHGNEYLVYDGASGAHGIGAFLLSSKRDGSWTAPRRVDPAGGSAMEPTVLARGDGQLAFAYYHSSAPDARDLVRDWTADAAVSHDGGQTFDYGSASGHVVYRGTEENAQLTLFDLLALAVDRDGDLDVVWTDDGATYPNDLKTQIEFAHQLAAPTLAVRGARARAALLRFVTPRGCVMPGRRFRVAVRSRPLVPIRRVDFFVGRRRVARDRRAPFAAMLMTSRHARPGARLHLRARVVVDVAQRSRDRSMRAVVRICG